MNFPSPKFMPQFSRLATYLVVFWVVFLLSRSIWQNWSLKNYITKLQDQIATLTEEKKELENLNIYYSSDSYKELEARKRLGLKKPGEKVVVLPISSPTAEPATFPDELSKEKERVAGVEAPSQIPNWLLWWQYLTK